MRAYQKSSKKLPLNKIPFFALVALFILPLLASPIIDIAGKSFGRYFVYFVFGYFLLSDESFLEKAEKYRYVMLSFSIVSTVLILIGWNEVITDVPFLVFDILSAFCAWTSILAFFGIGRRNLNFRNKITDYFSKSSFAVFFFHQTWVIVFGYYALAAINNTFLQMLAILVTSVIATFATYEICKRIFITRFLFGIRK